MFNTLLVVVISQQSFFSFNGFMNYIYGFRLQISVKKSGLTLVCIFSYKLYASL